MAEINFRISSVQVKLRSLGIDSSSLSITYFVNVCRDRSINDLSFESLSRVNFSKSVVGVNIIVDNEEVHV